MATKIKSHAYRPIAEMTRADIVDELGPLDEWYDGIKPKLDRMNFLREVVRGGGQKKLIGWAERDSKPRTEPVQYSGAKYQVQLSACSASSWIPSLGKVFESVGAAKFLKACSLTLKACRELIPDADANGFIETEPAGGSRDIVAVAPVSRSKAA